MMLREGDILGNRYEIISLVGTGGMASVYKAKDHRLNRIVAIKVLASQFGEDQEFIKKFNIEAQSAAAFSHPNIVSIYDVGEEKDLHFIVMEYVDGETLKKYIATKGYLDAKQIESFAMQIASGIKAAHDNKTIHRDIKPQNILVLSDEMTVKVTDFGIAKTPNASTVKMTTMGSIHYLSPEQARSGYVDERSDIYSLGITMYEMATGAVPFTGDNTVTIAIMHLEDNPVPPRELQPSIPRDLEKIILKCIQKRKDDRYQSMEELIEDLQKVFSNKQEVLLADDITQGTIMQDNCSTVILTEDDINKIKREIANQQLETEEEPGQEEKSMVSYETEQEAQEEEKEKEEVVDPKLEKLIIGLTALTGLIIVGIVLYFVVKTTGIFSTTTMKNKEANPTTVEAAEETKTSTQAKKDTATKQATEETTTEEDSEATTEEEKYVPNLIGLKKDDAKKKLEETGLEVEYKYQYSEVEENDVIAQSIDAGTKITNNATIVLTVSKGNEKVQLSNVVGMTQSQAEKELEACAVNIQYSYEYSKEEDKNKITAQSPEPGTEVEAGDNIKLTVSLGKEETKITVPDLAYYTEEEAKVQLSRIGLELGNVTKQNSDVVAKGQIMKQSIDAKKKVKAGTAIDVTVSAGVDEESYIYQGNITIQSCPFSDKDNANLTLTVSQDEEEKVFYDGLVTTKDFPLNVEFEGSKEGEAIIHVQVDGEDIGDSYIVQVNKVEK